MPSRSWSIRRSHSAVLAPQQFQNSAGISNRWDPRWPCRKYANECVEGPGAKEHPAEHEPRGFRALHGHAHCAHRRRPLAVEDVRKAEDRRRHADSATKEDRSAIVRGETGDPCEPAQQNEPEGNLLHDRAADDDGPWRNRAHRVTICSRMTGSSAAMLSLIRRFAMPRPAPRPSVSGASRRCSTADRTGRDRYFAAAARPTGTANNAQTPPSIAPLPSSRSGKYRSRDTATAAAAAVASRAAVTTGPRQSSP